MKAHENWRKKVDLVWAASEAGQCKYAIGLKIGGRNGNDIDVMLPVLLCCLWLLFEFQEDVIPRETFNNNNIPNKEIISFFALESKINHLWL